jgi:2-dehydro-3-deoxyphosphogluconate aldolase/(4S)-4-hydroxy-2-oxoglutarate aldolase
MRAKAKVVSDIAFVGIIPVIRAKNPDHIIPLCDALVEGGISVLELTMTIPNALEVMKRVIAHFGQRALVGMGSILDAKMARAALDAGAEFLVTPITKIDVAAAARNANRAVILGAYTPTEAQLAHESGADFVKIFPAETLGSVYIKALRAPMPHLRIVPTGGVTLENCGEFLQAGAAALGAGSSLVSQKVVDAANWEELQKTASAWTAAVKLAREKKS